MASSPHQLRLRVRYGETDQMGVVHHANYLSYMEDGRTRLMAEKGCSYAELERQGFGLPVRRAELRYWAPAYYDEELLVMTSVRGMRSASVTFEYEIQNAAGKRLATGVVELACVSLNSDQRKPISLPEHLRSVLSEEA